MGIKNFDLKYLIDWVGQEKYHNIPLNTISSYF